MLGLVFVTTLHPDPGKAGVDVHILRVELVRGLGGLQSRVVISLGKIDLRQRVPCRKGIGMGLHKGPQLGNSAIAVVQREIEGRFVDLILQ